MTRLIIQALDDLGYHGAANTLSRESGYEVESPAVALFRHAVLQGDWKEAEGMKVKIQSFRREYERF